MIKRVFLQLLHVQFFVFPRFLPAKCGMRYTAESADRQDWMLERDDEERQEGAGVWGRGGGGGGGGGKGC